MKLEAKVRLLASTEGAIPDDKKFFKFLQNEGIAATPASLKKGQRVKFYLKSPKTMIVVSDDWDKVTMSDKTAAENGVGDLKGAQEFFGRYGLTMSTKPTPVGKVGRGAIYD